MAFDRIIVKSLTNVAQSGLRMDSSLDLLKNRIITNTTNKLLEIPISLPFNAETILKEGEISNNLLTQQHTLSDAQKEQLSKNIEILENTLNFAIQQKNVLQGSLNSITSPLNTLETLSNTIDTAVLGLKTTVNIIKLLPIPSSVPPGIGIPLNVINGFSNSLDILKTIIDKYEGSLGILSPIIQQINNILIPLTDKLKSFDVIFEKLVKIIAYLKTLLKYSPNATQEDLDDSLQDTTTNIQKSLAVTSGPINSSSNEDINKATDKALLEQLNPNSQNPLIYKGFRLTIEFDENNSFNFPARRVKAVNNKNITLYSTPPNQGAGKANTTSPYSFSSSTQVLVDEVKFNIDQYLNEK